MAKYEIKYKTVQARESLPAEIEADHYVQHGRFFEFWSEGMLERRLLVSIAADAVAQITEVQS